MAVSYPLSASTFWEKLRFASRPEFVRLHKKKQSEDGGGNVRSASLGSPKWGATVALAGGWHDANMPGEADIGLMEMRDGTFLAYDIRRPWPAADDGGVKLAGGSVVPIGGEAAYGDVSLGVYRYEGETVALTDAVSVDSDAGTYWDADGVLQTALADVLRVDYGPFANLLDARYIKDFDNAFWQKFGVTTTANSIGAPDGTTTADTVTSSGTTFQGIYAVVSVAASTQYTLSFYARLGTLSASDFKMAIYNETAGSFFAMDIIPAQVPSTDGWTRVSYTFATPSGCTSIRAYPFRNSVGVTGTIYLWGAVLNAGATAPAYPRAPLGLMAEAAFSNLLQRSEEFDNAYWTKTRSSISANAATAPDGTTTADKLVDTTDNNSHLVGRTGIAIAAGQTVTGAMFVKASGRTRGSLRIQGSAGQCIANFDLTAKTASAVNSGSGVTSAATIKELGDGWFLVSVTGVATPTDTTTSLFLYTADASGAVSYIGDASSGLLCWGAQLETGTILHSYLKTTSSSVSRADDAMTLTARGVNEWVITLDDASTVVRHDISDNLVPSAATFGGKRVKGWTATRDTQPSASTVQIKSKGSNNRSIALKGLPPFFPVTKTDKISIAYSSTKVFLCEAMETVTADINGETAEFEIFPFLPAGIAVNDAVTLAKPCGKFKIVAGSYKPASGQGNISSGAGFSMVSVP